LTYAYDAGNRLAAQGLNGTVTSYSYDNSSELTGDGVNTLTFDGGGNRTNGGNTTGQENQLTSDGTWTYTYDNEGNLTKKSKGSSAETWLYTYDHRNRLLTAYQYATDGGTLEARIEYLYDVFGDRLQKSVAPGVGPAVLTHFAYDAGNAWADLDSNNQLLTRRLYTDATDALFARIAADGTAAWYLTDRLGSVRDLVDGSGAVQDHLNYDGFGNVLSESHPSFGDRYQWTGREFDSETGLQYNRARYYDPRIGR